MLNKLKKYDFFANLKKCYFHKDKVWFLDYIVSAQRIRIEDEQIEVVKNWLEPKLIKDIQVFLVLSISINVSSRASVRLLDYSP